MAVFRSKYRELSFNVGEEVHRFQDGIYKTDDPKVIAVIDKLRNVVRVDEPTKPKAEVSNKVEEESTKPKAASKRKTSAK